jgi:hypothetical protein
MEDATNHANSALDMALLSIERRYKMPSEQAGEQARGGPAGDPL